MDIVDEMSKIGCELIDKDDCDHPLPNWNFRQTGPEFSASQLINLMQRAGLVGFKFEMTWPGDQCHIFLLPEDDANEKI